jgi:hypothetical protein
MARKKSRLKVVLIGTSVFVAAMAAVIILYILTPKAIPPVTQGSVSLTKTPQYNACQVISIADIQNTFYGNLVTEIKPGIRIGTNAPNGTIADGCGFGLRTAKSVNNTLAVEVYPYTATVDGNDKETADNTWAEVASSNPKAYFAKATEGDTTIYKLRVIPGGKNVMFELRQPTNAIAIDQPSALDFLVGIATKANFSVINASSSNP